MARSSYELHIVRRTFILLIILVVLPSAGLSAFGILAIKNERASTEMRLNRSVDDVEQRLTDALAKALDESGRMGTPKGDPTGWIRSLRQDNHLYGRAMIFHRSTHERLLDEFSTDAPATNGVTEKDTELDSLSILKRAERLIHRGAGYFQMERGEDSLGEEILAAREVGDDLIFVYELNVAALKEELRAINRSNSSAKYVFHRMENSERDDRFFTMLAEMILPKTKTDAPSPLTSRRLAPPLADFEIAIFPSEETDARHSRTQILYIVLMSFFYIALAVGTTLVIHALFHEARLSKLKTDFVSAVSHDLRTPMTSIRLFVETLDMGQTTEAENKECIDMLLKETQRLSTMIERILDWSRIESGRKIYRVRAVPVASLLDEALAAFRTHNKIAGKAFDESRLQIRLVPSLPDALADPEAISGVIINLLENAQKHSGETSQITVSVGLWKNNPNKLIFSVIDKGKGISKATQKHIFDQFYRADDLLSRKTEGTGLGLAIARRVVKMHRGKIWVVSEPGQGCVFSFILPAAPVDR